MGPSLEKKGVGDAPPLPNEQVLEKPLLLPRPRRRTNFCGRPYVKLRAPYQRPPFNEERIQGSQASEPGKSSNSFGAEKGAAFNGSLF